MKKLIATFLMALMLMFSPGLTVKAALSDSHKALSAATFALYGQLDQERHFLCTAETYDWNKEDGYKLITAGHCVTGEDLPEDLDFFVAETADPNPVLMPVTVLKAENDNYFDFAVLSLKTDKVYPLMHLAPEGRPLPQPEDIIVNVNFNLGITKEIVLGRVASGIIPNKGAENNCDLCMGRFMVNVDNGPGASGSAIVDEGSQEVVGLTEAGDSKLPGIALCISINSFWVWQNTHETLPRTPSK